MNEHLPNNCNRARFLNGEPGARTSFCERCTAPGVGHTSCPFYDVKHTAGDGYTFEVKEEYKKPHSMADKVVSLAAKRAETDGRKWTPLDCLEQLVKDIRQNIVDPDTIFIAMRVKDGDDAHRYPWSWAGPSEDVTLATAYRSLKHYSEQE